MNFLIKLLLIPIMFIYMLIAAIESVLTPNKNHQNIKRSNPVDFHQSLNIKGNKNSMQRRNVNRKAINRIRHRMVKIHLICSPYESKHKCKKVENILNEVALDLERAVSLKRTIYIDVSFQSFSSNNQGECLDLSNHIIGKALPVSYLPVKDLRYPGRIYYPKALAKQIYFEDEFPGADIKATFNSDIDYYLDESRGIKAGEIDIKLAFSHEILHGLGFSSFYAEYMKENSNYNNVYTVSKNKNDGTYKVEFIHTIFDVFVTFSSNNQTITSYLNRMSNVINKKKFTDETKLRNYCSDIINQVTKFLSRYYTTPNSLNFNTKNSIITLETSLIPFQMSSSLSHFDYELYRYTKDFLMVYTHESGDTLKDIVRLNQNWDTIPFGPLTLEILEQMGYVLKNPIIY